MTGIELCGELKPDHEDEKCMRQKLHKGRHRGRRGIAWANRAPRPKYGRYLPPHVREEGAPAPSGRRYRRPQSDESSTWESANLSDATEE